ncbi:MAG: hypothetical protein QXM75_00665 [Candidatus Diapherotrites archaeon]
MEIIQILLLSQLMLFTEIIQDFMLVLKIFALISIISFVLNHVENRQLAVLLILGISWFIIFEYWVFFGGIYLFYVLLTLGISGMLVDFFFIGGMTSDRRAAMAENENSPVSSSLDLAQRTAKLQAARNLHAMAKRRGGLPR